MGLRQDELWDRADALLDRLLDLAGHARLDALRGMGLPADLESCVRRLLEAHDRRGALDRAPRDPHWGAPSTLVGRRVGGWVLQHELGRGGMSVVWRGCRGREDTRQWAAIKLYPVGALARHDLLRFRREQSILSRLNHPHIAHLYEAGEAEDGTPFLAMEEVDGVRIDTWCERKGLDAAARVRLMLLVCAAIAYAHRNLVVHADLKPSNVMVDREGLVRVLDFGIGRLLDERFMDMTVTLARAVTPEYAAPEQLAGEHATTAADVFGLGALLYRLLTGCGPREHEFDGTVLPPSRALRMHVRGGGDGHGVGVADVRGDLDAIVLKALRPEPEQRYASVDALQADLCAWLDQMPVAARAPGWFYRVRKFVRRNRLAVAACLVVALAVTAGVATTIWQARRAQGQAQRATAVKDFLIDILDASDPTQVAGRDPRASELLRQGAKRIRTRLRSSPGVRAELLLVIGRSQLARGQLDDARHSLDTALHLFDRGVARDPRVHAQVLVERGMLYYEQGRNPRALGDLQQAVAVLDRDVPDDPSLRDGTLAKLADMQVVNDQPKAAAVTAGRLVAAMRRGGRTHNRDYAYALRVRGEAESAQRHYKRAVSWLLKARAALSGMQAPIDEASTDNELGLAYDGLGKEGRAAQLLSAALKLQVRVYGLHHPTTLATLGNLAAVRYRQGRAADAAREYERIIPIQQEIVGKGAHPDVVVNLGWLALSRYRAGDTGRAWHAAQRALVMLHALPVNDRDDLGWIEPLNGLLGWETGHARSWRLLDRGSVSCSDLADISTMARWICLARALRDADAGHCRAPPGKAPDTLPGDAVDRRWWAVFHLLRARCGAPAQRASEWHAAKALQKRGTPRFPAWLRTRLARMPRFDRR